MSELKIGFFRHWFQPPYPFVDFLREQGLNLLQIDYGKKGYLEGLDVALIEQDGFDDYIENDGAYILDWVARGGILLFMHQDWRRWAPFFLTEDCGYVQLIHRHAITIREANGLPSWNYMLPRVEEAGRRLFQEPNRIQPDELLGWHVPTQEFGLIKDDPQTPPATFETAALSCYLPDRAHGWEVLGSYKDPAVKDGALLLQKRHGKGFVFLCQLLFPERRVPQEDACLAFWRRFLPNLTAHFARLKAGDTAVPPRPKASLPPKPNYNLAIHMHSLDWFGCDSSLGTIEAIMRRWKIDICGLAVKDTACYDGHLDLDAYSNEGALFLHGQEYHPFNWGDSHAKDGHNTYHLLALGIDGDAYTPEFTRSLFSDEEVDAYMKRAIAYVHEHHGVIIATHPYCDAWTNYPCDGADLGEVITPLAGTAIEAQWLKGRRFTLMHSVDLFGYKRLFANPGANFIYIDGVPDRDTVCEAVRKGRVIAACFFHACDITLDGARPGETVSRDGLREFRVRAEAFDGDLREARLYAGTQLVATLPLSGRTVDTALPVPKELPPEAPYLRMEIDGTRDRQRAATNPFWLA